MKRLITALLLTLTLAACGQQEAPYAIECPSDQTCNTTPVTGVTPPPMTYAEIQYHAAARDMTADVLLAMMVQYSTYSNCWGCFNRYWSDPFYSPYRSRFDYYYGLPPSQRVTVVQQQNVTVINNNKNVIQQARKTQPPASQMASTVKGSTASPVSKPATTTSPASAPKTTVPSPVSAPKPVTNTTSTTTKPAGGGVAGGSSFKSK